MLDCLSTLFHSSYNRCKVVVQQYHVGCVLGGVGAGYSHGDADVCFLQCGRIIDTISSYCHYGTLGKGRKEDRLADTHKIYLIKKIGV